MELFGGRAALLERAGLHERESTEDYRSDAGRSP
jgi:hypothetical protein